MPNATPDPLSSRTPIVDPASGAPTPYFIQQWNVQFKFNGDVIQLAAQITENSERIAALRATEIGGDGTDIEPVGAPLADGNIILGLTDTAVTPGTYGDATNSAQITVDAKGRITEVIDVPISGGGGGGGAWEVIVNTTVAAPIAEIDVDVSGYDEVLVIFNAYTKSASQQALMRISTDGGSTFYNTTSDYRSVADAGTFSGNTGMVFGGTSAGALAGYAHLFGISDATTAAKFVRTTSGANTNLFIGSSDAITDIRLYNSLGANFTGGTLIVLGKAA